MSQTATAAPAKKSYTTIGSNGTYYVALNGHAVCGGFAKLERAEDVREMLERRAKVKTRKCMTCRAEFESEGAHNQRCNDCRGMFEPCAV